MKARNFIGQMMIYNAVLTRAANKIEILALLQATKFNLKQNLVEIAKNNVERANELINDSCHSAFIAGNGLVPLVLNEEADPKNHNLYSKISNEIYELFENLFIKPNATHANVINLQSYKIRSKKIEQIINLLYETY
jgi:hypothetical protein